jgi:hypothetical protein
VCVCVCIRERGGENGVGQTSATDIYLNCVFFLSSSFFLPPIWHFTPLKKGSQSDSDDTLVTFFYFFFVVICDCFLHLCVCSPKLFLFLFFLLFFFFFKFDQIYVFSVFFSVLIWFRCHLGCHVLFHKWSRSTNYSY